VEEGSCEHENEPSGSIKCSEILGAAEGLAASQDGKLHGVSWLFTYLG
jgi:hypothetical protein